jgi:hypothetical protein
LAIGGDIGNWARLQSCLLRDSRWSAIYQKVAVMTSCSYSVSSIWLSYSIY